ncbi:MAG: putative zinc-binding metallopeptidase [Hyphomicrobiaceae bacterium]
MRTFNCTNCGKDVYFENSVCLSCGAELGFDPAELKITALKPNPKAGGVLSVFRRSAAKAAPKPMRRCANAAHAACNWLLKANDPGELCSACILNRTIPDLSDPQHLAAWRAVENAKKRLVYSLLRLGLPISGVGDIPPMTFDVMQDAQTGHLDGVITIDVAEADSVERERRREQLDEPYRSLLGHLRHESAHYYWPIVVEKTGLVKEFRSLFGDERRDYGGALSQYHANGPAPDWQASFVSAYATAHPWEDWAETWAHYLHILDTVDTAESVGIEPRSKGMSEGSTWPYGRTDVYRGVTVGALMERWAPLASALNDLTRSMGHPDFYPFVTAAPTLPKFAFVNRAIRQFVESPMPVA